MQNKNLTNVLSQDFKQIWTFILSYFYINQTNDVLPNMKNDIALTVKPTYTMTQNESFQLLYIRHYHISP